MKWFRLYDDLVDNPKVQQLPAALFKHWINFLCLANKNKNRGSLPTAQEIAFRLRISPRRIMGIVDALIVKKLINPRESGGYLVHDWQTFQYQSDDINARVLKTRNKLQENVTLHPTLHVTPSDTDTDTEQIQSRADTEHKAASRAQQPEESKPKKERPKDEAYEIWASEFLEHREVPYINKQADFVQLARIRKAHGLNGKGLPNGWNGAVHNYLASPLTAYTLADLCTRYDCFIHGEVDRFGKPAGFNDVHQANKATLKSLQEKGFFNE